MRIDCTDYVIKALCYCIYIYDWFMIDFNMIETALVILLIYNNTVYIYYILKIMSMIV